MKTIVAVTPEFPPITGGISGFLADTLGQLSAHTHVRLLLPADLASRVHASLPSDAVTPSRLMGSHWLRFVPALVRSITDHAADVVLVSHVLPFGTVALITKLLTRTPYVVCVHGLDIASAETDPRKRWLMGQVLRQSALVVANSNYTLARVRVHAPETKAVVVYPGPHIRPGSASVPALGKRFVLAAGRMVPRKGFRTLVRAVALAKERVPDIHVVCAGDGPEKQELIADIKDLGLQTFFTVRSATDAELSGLYSNCAFFALPTQSSEADPEGFGMVFLESAAFGKASIAGSGGGVNEAVVDGQTGILLNGAKPQEIADAIVRLWQDPLVATEMGRAGQARVERLFSGDERIRPLVVALDKL